MKTVLLTGATGMVGQQVLELLLTRSDVGVVRSVVRRASGFHDHKLFEVVHEDFLDFSEHTEIFDGVDLCIYCLGVYQNQVGEEQFFEVTCDCQNAFTDRLSEISPQTVFVLFSAQGADPRERSRFAFARAKGRAEKLLLATPFAKKYIFRPGYIFPSGNRQPRGMPYRTFAKLAGAIRRFGIDVGIRDRDLAMAMVEVGMSANRETGVFETLEIKEIARAAP